MQRNGTSGPRPPGRGRPVSRAGPRSGTRPGGRRSSYMARNRSPLEVQQHVLRDGVPDDDGTCFYLGRVRVLPAGLRLQLDGPGDEGWHRSDEGVATVGGHDGQHRVAAAAATGRTRAGREAPRYGDRPDRQGEARQGQVGVVAVGDPQVGRNSGGTIPMANQASPTTGSSARPGPRGRPGPPARPSTPWPRPGSSGRSRTRTGPASSGTARTPASSGPGRASARWGALLEAGQVEDPHQARDLGLGAGVGRERDADGQVHQEQTPQRRRSRRARTVWDRRRPRRGTSGRPGRWRAAPCRSRGTAGRPRTGRTRRRGPGGVPVPAEEQHQPDDAQIEIGTA